MYGCCKLLKPFRVIILAVRQSYDYPGHGDGNFNAVGKTTYTKPQQTMYLLVWLQTYPTSHHRLIGQ